MAELREVRILIGRRSYRMQTTLDEATLDRVTSLVAEIGADLGTGFVNHDNLLMLTTLQLAYTLDKISQRLLPLHDRLQETESLDL